MENKIWAIVVAAGRGTRFGQPYNKVFHKLKGKSVLRLCMEALENSSRFDGAVLVLSEQDEVSYQSLISEEGTMPLVSIVVNGGSSRQESVYNGLKAIPADAQIVAIHDAARPFVTRNIIGGVLDAALCCGSGIPGMPVTDTIKIMDDDNCAIDTPPRDHLCAVQTPQAFAYDRIVAAHKHAIQDSYQATDDAALYEKYIGKVQIVMHPDCVDNTKVTTIKDVKRFETCAFRTGTGYDAHRLVEGRKLILCGVDIPYEKGLLGHSDADVAVHALMDALLGAAALGDIGRHFPDSDEQYRGISSLLLLEHVMILLHEKGYQPVNVDVTIVAQRPKLKNYIEQMQENVAKTMNLSKEYVNIKATTTEGMGFEGEGLGISAQAAALIERI